MPATPGNHPVLKERKGLPARPGVTMRMICGGQLRMVGEVLVSASPGRLPVLKERKGLLAAPELVTGGIPDKCVAGWTVLGNMVLPVNTLLPPLATLSLLPLLKHIALL